MGYPNVTEYVCDRHDKERFRSLAKGRCYDAVLDFCAYEPGDIRTAFEALSGGFRQYIYISTASVLKARTGEKPDESAEIRDAYSEGPVESYVKKKAGLEFELAKQAADYGAAYTIFRPAFIYGPFNYAPRESWYIEKIAKGEPLPYPYDATGRFSMLYVMDVEKALRAAIGNEKAFGETFNLAGEEEVSYEMLFREMRDISKVPFDIYEVSVEEAIREGLPLPFPLQEDALYGAAKAPESLGFSYTGFHEAFAKTMEVFLSVYGA